MAPSKDYWIRRAEELEKRAAEQGETLIRQALRHYKRAAQEISSQIEEFYGRYASEQGLSYAEAVKVLRGSEAKAWTKTLGVYVDEINALPDGALKDRLKAELDARAYSSRITRLDALKAQVDMEVDRLMIDLEDGMGEGFGDLYTDSYYRKMFDIQQHAGKMFDFAHLNRELVEQTLSYPWSGADFSSRLWENKRALLFHLREIMTQGAIQGKGVAALSKELSDKLGQSYKTAERLIRTEANHFHNAADVAAYKAAGVRQYEFIATLDNRTSAVCAGLDGKVFDIGDAQTGVNYPPMHPNCRSTTVEYDPDEWKDWETIGQPMPERMTYAQWAAEQGIETPEVLKDNTENGRIKLKMEFTPANSAREAKEYALSVLHLDNVDYDRFDLDVANSVNREITAYYDVFGDLHEQGVLRSVMYYPKEQNFYAAYQPSSGIVYMREVREKDSLEKMLKTAQENFAAGFWSTDQTEHAIRHELGHAVQMLFTKNNAAKQKQIAALRNELEKVCGITQWSLNDSAENMKKAGQYLSYYALRDDWEFIAEAVAEYMGGSPRETARKVMDILLRKD